MGVQVKRLTAAGLTVTCAAAMDGNAMLTASALAVRLPVLPPLAPPLPRAASPVSVSDRAGQVMCMLSPAVHHRDTG